MPLDNSSFSSTDNVLSSIQSDETIIPKKKRTAFFVCEPIIVGFVIFPLLAWFWQSSWNFMLTWVDGPFGQHRAVLPLLYIVCQVIFLFIYITQDHLYNFLVKQELKFFAHFILQVHSFITALNYLVQWITMWTILDRYTSNDWVIILLLSIIAILTIIVLTGQACDLVCAPFVISYDAIEYNVHIETPLETEKMNPYLAHILNYMYYEHIIALLNILAWRGTYGFLDVHLYPDNQSLSACLCLLIAYPLFFLLMYTQSIPNDTAMIPKFIHTNFPSLFENLRHVLTFIVCILFWRGYWMLLDTHIATVSLAETYPYAFYGISTIVSFILLSFLRTASSINGPMSNMEDEYNLFPLYPNCFLVKWFNKETKSNKSSSNLSQITDIEPFTITMF